MTKEQLDLLLEYIDARVEEKIKLCNGHSTLVEFMKTRELADELYNSFGLDY